MNKANPFLLLVLLLLLVCLPWFAESGGECRRTGFGLVCRPPRQVPPKLDAIRMGGFTLEGMSSVPENSPTQELRRVLQPHPLLVVRTPDRGRDNRGIAVRRDATTERGLRCNVYRANGTFEEFSVMSSTPEAGVRVFFLGNPWLTNAPPMYDPAIGPNANDGRQANIVLRLPTTQPAVELLSAECWVPSPPAHPTQGEEPRTRFYVLLVTAPNAVTRARVGGVSIPSFPPPRPRSVPTSTPDTPSPDTPELWAGVNRELWPIM